MKRFPVLASLILVALFVAGIALAEETSVTSMTLDQALAYAEANSLQLQAAHKDLQIAESNLAQAYSAYFPTFEASLTETINPSQPAGLDNFGNANVSLTQMLFNTPIYIQYNLEKNNLKMSQIDYEEAKTDLRFNVSNAFFAVCKAKEGIKIANDSVALAEKNLRMVKANFDAGIVVKTDVLKMELGVSNAKQGLLTAENGYRIALAGLKQLIGLSQNKELEVVSPSPLPDSSVVSMPAAPYEGRYDLQKATIVIDSADLGIKLAKAGYQPTAFASCEYSNSFYSPDPQNTSGDGNFSVTIGLKWSFSLGGKVKSAIAKAEQSKNKAEIRLEAAKQSAITEVLQYQLGYNEALRRVELSGLALKIAQENSNLAVKRYEAGVGTTLEVSDAQVALERAKNDELNARYDLFLAGIKLKKALGLYNEMLGQGADSK